MKKFIILILSLILSVTMISCNNGGKEIEQKDKEYLIYPANNYYENPLVLENKENSNVKVSSGRKKFYLETSGPLERDSKAKDTYTYEVGKEKNILNFEETFKMGAKKLNKYQGEGRLYIEADAATGEIAFLRTNADRRTEEGNLSEEQAKKIAEETICGLYGSNVLKEYKHWITTTKDSCYYVAYSKYVYGILTNDDIEIGINMKGEIVSINARYKGILAGIEKEVSQKDIESALAALKEFLGDSWTIDDFKQIVTDSEGDYYINAFIRRTVDGEPQSEQLYISLQ